MILRKKNNCLLTRRVCCFYQSNYCIRVLSHTNQIAALGYISLTDQISSFGYVSCTNHITAFGYRAPITVLGYCFLVNDVMESGGCAQRVANDHKFCAYVISVMIVAFARALSSEVEIFGI